MFKKTWELFDQMFETFDAEMAEAIKMSNQNGDGEIEEVREEETRVDGTRVVRITKRRLMMRSR